MVDFKEHFKDELNNNNTNYFIFDTAGPGAHGDVDFNIYCWNINRYNLVRENDLFVYRRQQNASEIVNQFYFFGAGKIEKIISISDVRVQGIISKPYIFKDKLLKDDLVNFIWSFKIKGDTWEHFFNQYGMNKINKEDFINLLNMQQGEFINIDQLEDNSELEVKLYQQQQRENYFVDDQFGNTKIRGAAQKTFADKVKINYNYTCALTGIKTKEFLVASHIIPWSDDKENRLNPKNGICFSIFIDKAFDQGYITISKINTLIISKKAKEDEALYNLLKPYQGKSLNIKKIYAPGEEFLKWHRENIFRK